MFAYVKYTDGEKKIVPVIDIRNFILKEHHLQKLYLIRWGDQYFKGQVLLLKDTLKEMELELANPTKRIRVAKIHEEDKFEDKNGKDGEVLPKKLKRKNAVQLQAKKSRLLAILQERKAHCVKPTLSNEETQDDEKTTDDEDSSTMVPKTQLINLQRKYSQEKMRLKTTQEELNMLKKNHDDLMKEVQELRDLRAINENLREIADVLRNNFMRHGSGDNGAASSMEQSLTGIPTGEVLLPPCFFDIQGEKIHLGEDIWIRYDVWKRICAHQRDSLFVKELAVAIWGTATLKDRSLTGKECPTIKGDARPPLTPSKLRALKGCFTWWLNQQDLEQPEIERRKKVVGHYISQKIMDIRKKDKKAK